MTVDGDRADRRGALTGGFHDVRRSRLDSVKAVKKWREAYDTDSARHAEVKAGIQRLEQQISTSMGQLQVLEARRKQAVDQRQMLAWQTQSLLREEDDLRQRLGRLENSLSEAEAELRDAVAKRESYEEEMKTPLRQQLTDAEIRSLDTLTREVEEQKRKLVEATRERQKVRWHPKVL